MRIVELNSESKQDLLQKLLKRSTNDYKDIEDKVRDIIRNVTDKGDEAIFEYAKKFDGCDLDASSFMVILLFQIGSHGTVIHLKGDVLVAVCAVPIVFCVRGVLWELNPPFPAAEFAVYTALSFLQKPDRMPGFCGNTSLGSCCD